MGNVNKDWVKKTQHKEHTFKIEKDRKPFWNNFFVKNIQLNTVNKTSYDLIESLENNFFAYHNLKEQDKHYAKMCLLVLLEERMDINSIHWENFFKSSIIDPQKILLLANRHNYLLIKETSLFLESFNNVKIDINEINEKNFLNPCFASEEFMKYKFNSHRSFRELQKTNEKIEKLLNNYQDDDFINIHTQYLLSWNLLNKFTKNEENILLLLDLIEDKIIAPGLVVEKNKNNNSSLFEFLMLRPQKENVEILKTLLRKYPEDFNFKATVDYFRKTLIDINKSFEADDKIMPDYMSSYYEILKTLELLEIKENLILNLKNKDDDKKITKI